ncbi:sensor histidine kinase [Reichenbachiella ulvae]|uniref:histidine kinase n=1 Tax=Reichenbachiella ulvae TaxID=2980104 RepID=A0ABT3CZM5_9BACT|nr:HAMP domain-containing sensor histidine kinase [Reichenbachiella ulvae]MCV9389024.1 HAMP domain-containing histidine kinase [Reichenbachiella ulvae]
MKLSQKFILAYFILCVIVISSGGIFYYFTFTQLVDRETDYELNNQVRQLSSLIQKGIPYDSLIDEHINIQLIKDTADIQESREYLDTIAYHRPFRAVTHHRKIKQVKPINNNWYRFELYESMIEQEDTFDTTFQATLTLFVFLAVLSLIAGFFISRYLLGPFNQSLVKIKNFNLEKGVPVEAIPSSTFEFKKLNEFLTQMSKKAIADYKNLKEFSGDIAHEIRTPMAIASGKLDLLMQHQSLSEEQMEWIVDAQKALGKVSRIQQSLVILSRIENNEFNKLERLRIDTLIERICEEKEDLFEMRGISIEKSLEPTETENDPTLVEIMLNNLIQNAIKHNLKEGGSISIQLSHNQLKITNPGLAPKGKTEELLQRFRKESTTNDSIGLGLSIVQKICEVSDYTINYRFDDKNSLHQISISL